MAKEDTVPVAKADLSAAWAVLENLAVSLDQIGGACGSGDAANGAGTRRAIQEALMSYLTPVLLAAINDARTRLGRYIPDQEAEELVERIPYWDHACGAKVPGQPA
jgi:hypothetical protein